MDNLRRHHDDCLRDDSGHSVSQTWALLSQQATNVETTSLDSIGRESDFLWTIEDFFSEWVSDYPRLFPTKVPGFVPRICLLGRII